MRRFVVALSGGVDSSVAAAIMVRRFGADKVAAVHMRNWEETGEADSNRSECADRNEDDARIIARRLGIPIRVKSYAREYWHRVFAPTLHEYSTGEATPNPDLLCNRHIKFGVFLDDVSRSGAGHWSPESMVRSGTGDDTTTDPIGNASANAHMNSCVPVELVTGHYCQRDDSGRLYRGADSGKDQAYFLAGVKSPALRKVVFPLGAMKKRAVRKLADQWALPTASKRDSTGICFVGPKRDFSEFLGQYVDSPEGAIFRADTGEAVDGQRHRGLSFYTVGQGARLGGHEEALYVVSKDAVSNRLFVAPRGFYRLWQTGAMIRAPSWVLEGPRDGEKLQCQVRHLQPPVPCSVTFHPGDANTNSDTGKNTDESVPVRVTFGRAIRGVAPGQWLVLYRGDECLGGGPMSDVTDAAPDDSLSD